MPRILSLDRLLRCASCGKEEIVHERGELSGRRSLGDALATDWVLLSPPDAEPQLFLCSEHAADAVPVLWQRYSLARAASAEQARLHARLEALVQWYTGEHHRGFSADELVAELEKAVRVAKETSACPT
jgi:hypothetical protein